MGSLWSARWEPFVLDHPPLDLLDGDLAEALGEVVQSQYHQLGVVGGDRVHGGDLGIIILGHKCQEKLSPAPVSPARKCPPPLRVVALAHPGVVLAEVLSAKMSVLIPFERQELTLDPE